MLVPEVMFFAIVLAASLSTTRRSFQMIAIAINSHIDRCNNNYNSSHSNLLGGPASEDHEMTPMRYMLCPSCIIKYESHKWSDS